MFVRKGTVRKNRGGANRRSVRRPRRDSNENNGGHRRKGVTGEAISTDSANGYELTINGDIEMFSASGGSLHYGSTFGNGNISKRSSLEEESHPSISNVERVSHFKDDFKSSPARSQATTILVRHVLFSHFFCVCITLPGLKIAI